jgi:hypothetical protein
VYTNVTLSIPQMIKNANDSAVPAKRGFLSESSNCLKVINSKMKAKLSPCLIKFYAFLSSALDEGEWSASYPHEKTHRNPLDKRLGEKKNLFPVPAGNRTPVKSVQ